MKVICVLLGAICTLATGQLFEKGNFFINEMLNWKDAQQYCRQHYTDLSIHANRWEHDMLPEQAKSYVSWIGLHFVDGWKWTDGEDVSFMKWNNSQPDVQAYKKCAYIHEKKWFADNCETQHYFICFRWMRKQILVRENKTWEDALEHCRSHHNDLGSLQNILKLNITKNISSEAQTPHVWTSLRFLAGQWLWIDLNPEFQGMYESNLLPQCPVQPLHCGAFNWMAPTSAFHPSTLTNRDCQEKLNFICYRKQ